MVQMALMTVQKVHLGTAARARAAKDLKVQY